ncbi:MAG: HAD family hydrolase [Chloroflexota bacterium]|nr:HAD family hydrolase [Chloroflexota bacterium]MDE2919266.1 HAD family hydrolase [Chloroflexota bacterium]
MPIRGVIFDVGDTLLTQEPLVGSPSNRRGAAAIAPLVRPFLTTQLTDEQLAESLGEALQEALVEAYQHECALPDVHGILAQVLDAMDWEPSAEVVEVLLPAYFEPWYQAMQPLPQAVRVLQLLREAGLRVALIANVLYGEDLLLERLRTLTLAPHLDAVVFSTELGWLKPHPAPYRAAAQRLGLSPRTLVMVGDDWEVDVRAAQRLGIRAIWLRSADVQPRDESAAAVIDDLGDLIPAIAGLDQQERAA